MKKKQLFSLGYEETYDETFACFNCDFEGIDVKRHKFCAGCGINIEDAEVINIKQKSLKDITKDFFEPSHQIYVDPKANIDKNGEVIENYKGDGSITSPFIDFNEAIELANKTKQDIYNKGI
jgi:hypothetical protein